MEQHKIVWISLKEFKFQNMQAKIINVFKVNIELQFQNVIFLTHLINGSSKAHLHVQFKRPISH